MTSSPGSADQTSDGPRRLNTAAATHAFFSILKMALQLVIFCRHHTYSRKRGASMPCPSRGHLFPARVPLDDVHCLYAIAASRLRAGFMFHSLRHGDAWLQNVVPIADIMRRGRWRSQRTCELYCQSGRAILATLAAPQELLRVSGAFDGDFVGMVQQAPTG